MKRVQTRAREGKKESSFIWDCSNFCTVLKARLGGYGIQLRGTLTVSSQKLSRSDLRCCLDRVISHRPPRLFLSSSHMGSMPSCSQIKTGIRGQRATAQLPALNGSGHTLQPFKAVHANWTEQVEWHGSFVWWIRVIFTSESIVGITAIKNSIQVWLFLIQKRPKLYCSLVWYFLAAIYTHTPVVLWRYWAKTPARNWCQVGLSSNHTKMKLNGQCL